MVAPLLNSVPSPHTCVAGIQKSFLPAAQDLGFLGNHEVKSTNAVKGALEMVWSNGPVYRILTFWIQKVSKG